MGLVTKLIVFAWCIHAVQLASVADKKDGFGNENFLTKAVDVPRVHEGSGQIHKISDSKVHGPAHDKKELDDLLRPIFEKFVLNKKARDVASSKGQDVRFGQDGKAYKGKTLIPNQEKRGTGKHIIGVDGKARHVKSRIPNTQEKRDEGGISMKEITDSVEKLIEKLSQEKQQKKESDGFKFQSVGDKKEVESIKEKKSDVAFKEFSEKFSKLFLKEVSDSKTKRQGIIGTGKDHETQLLISTGKDSNENKVDVRSARLNHLYDELRKETTARMKEKREKQNKRERLEIVKKDLLDLMNGLQSHEKFTYDGEKFAVADSSGPLPGLINHGKDHKVSSTPEKKDESKLETVELLAKELRELKDAKERKEIEERESSGNIKKSAKRMESAFLEAYKKDMDKKKDAPTKKKEVSRLETVELLVKELKELEDEKEQKKLQEKREHESTGVIKKSAKKMENVFLKTFKREMSKRKESATKKEVVAKEEGEKQTKKESEEQSKTVVKDNSVRGMLMGLMGELEKRIVNEKSKVEEDEKQISQLEKASDVSTGSKSKSQKSFEEELDSILTDLSSSNKREVKTKDWATDKETMKALEGFNVNDATSITKAGRP